MKHTRLSRTSLRIIVLVGFLASMAGPAWAQRKGPDAGGYTATDAAIYSFVDISGIGGGASILAGADDGIAALTLPFSFVFYGVPRTMLCVSSNGAAYFIASLNDCSHFNDFANVDLTSSAPPDDRPGFFPLWTDLTFDVPGADAVIYKTLGAAGSRRFVVQWNNAYPQGSQNPVTFQAVLFEGSNKILFQYKKVALGPGNPASNGAQATVGIRNGGGLTSNQQIEWTFNVPVIADESAVSFSGDTTPPVTTAALSGPPGTAGWYRGSVQVTLIASDAEGAVGATSYSLDGSAMTPYAGPFAVSGDAVHQVSFSSTDASGNQEPPRLVEIKIDATSPTINLTAPTASTYTVNQVVLAAYSCSDGGSGLSSCTGPVASGSPVATSVAGSTVFAVNAADNAGNSALASRDYVIAYGVCLRYDAQKVHKVGSTIPIKIQLCDASGANLSTASTTVTATSVFLVSTNSVGPLEDSGTANPDFNFRYTEGAYTFNLSSTGLSAGTYGLRFTAGADPTSHVVGFKVK